MLITLIPQHKFFNNKAYYNAPFMLITLIPQHKFL